MNKRMLMLGLFTAALAHAASRASAEVLELVVPTKAGVSPPNAIAEIKVDGASQDGPYDTVINKTLDYIVAVRGDKPKKAIRPGLLFIEFGDSSMVGSIRENWKYYAISAPYRDPWSNQVANVQWSPVQLCNERLNATPGEARKAFLKKGVSFDRAAAYGINARLTWVLDDGVFEEIKTYAAATPAPVKITCMPLDRPRPRQDGSTKGPPPREGKPMAPTISEVHLRIEPMQVTKMGKFLCPAQLRLYGKVAVVRDFTGKSVFVGPHYVSRIHDVTLKPGSASTVTATDPMTWHKMGDKAIAPNAAPAKQKLTFRYNVSNEDGKVLESAERTIEVNCRKIAVNAPTGGDGMTVNPAN